MDTPSIEETGFRDIVTEKFQTMSLYLLQRVKLWHKVTFLALLLITIKLLSLIINTLVNINFYLTIAGVSLHIKTFIHKPFLKNSFKQ